MTQKDHIHRGEIRTTVSLLHICFFYLWVQTTFNNAQYGRKLHLTIFELIAWSILTISDPFRCIVGQCHLHHWLALFPNHRTLSITSEASPVIPAAHKGLIELFNGVDLNVFFFLLFQDFSRVPLKQFQSNEIEIKARIFL